MKKWFINLIVFFVLSSNIFAQIDLSHISLKLGSIRNTQKDFNNFESDKHTFYPEFEIGGNFFIDNFFWGVSLGYWNEDIEKSIPVADYMTLSNKSIALGFRIDYSFGKTLFNTKNLDLLLSVGFTYNIIKVKNITADLKPEFNDYVTQPYLGLKVKYNLINNFSILGEIGSHIRVNDKYTARPVYMFGIGYNLFN